MSEQRPDPVPADEFATRVPATTASAFDTRLPPAESTVDPFCTRVPEVEAAIPRPTTAGTPEVPGYQILGRLGRGAMGVVFEARQVQANRRVALKMIQPFEEGAVAFRARFRREAEAAARLSHPNIVPVYEVGEASGRPFFSMELCPGGSLADRLDGKPLHPKQAAGLIEVLARAMYHAHTAGVVHRDLKPGNVLLTAEGEPKVADFGLAKQLDAAGGASVAGAVFGTPEYMPPEQARGKHTEVGPAADVYALGAILYEMLTGRPPFRGADAYETIEQVCTSDPVPVRRLQPKVPRDLETITLKCLHKEQGRRYATADELADDLRRFRSGEPVRARPVRRWERAWKWAKRRPGMAALWATVVVVTAVSFGLVTWAWQRAADKAEDEAIARREAQELAEKNYRLAEDANAAAEAEKSARVTSQQVTDFLAGLFEASDPTGFNIGLRRSRERSKELSAVELLNRGAERVERETDGLTRAALQDVIGNVYRSVNRYAEAERFLSAGLAERRRQLGEDHLDVATSFFHLGWLRQELGDYDEAERLYRQALDIRRRHLSDGDPRIAESIFHLGLLLAEMYDPAAEPVLREAIRMSSAKLGPNDRQTGMAKAGLAAFLLDQGRPSEALAPMLEAMNVFRQVDGMATTQAAVTRFQSAIAARAMGGAWGARQAESLMRECLALVRPHIDNHPYVAFILHELAVTLVHNDRQSEEAEKLWRECLAIIRETVTMAHPRALIPVGDAAWHAARRGHPEEGVALFEELLKANADRFGPRHRSRIKPLLTYGHYLARNGGIERAEEMARAALALFPAGEPPADQALAFRLADLADALSERGDGRLAESLCRASLGVFRKLDDAPNAAEMTVRLAAVLIRRDSWGEADTACREAEAIARYANLPRGTRAALARNRGRIERARGDSAAAEALLREALPPYRADVRTRPGMLIDALDDLAGVLLDQGKVAEAVPLVEETLALVQSSPKYGHAVREFQWRLGLARLAGGDVAGARDLARLGFDGPPLDAQRALDLLTLTGGPDVNWAEVVLAAEAAVKAKPTDLGLRYLLGSALSRAGRFAESEPHLRAPADGSSPLWVLCRVRLALDQARRGNGPAARALLTEADKAVAVWPGPYAAARLTWQNRLRIEQVRRETERLLAEPPEPVPPPAVRE
jgi:tetratricopeptide (TPR) repeat protein